MIDNLKKNWGKITFMLALWATLFGWTMNEFANAEQVLKQIAKVALELEKPKSDLVDYLVNKGMNKKEAKEITSFNIGPADSTGVLLRVGKRYVELDYGYNVGLLMKRGEEKDKILDTLWDFRNEDTDNR